jgi:hypothetical protein
VPALFGVGTLLKPCLTVYGDKFDAPTWFADSPVAQVPTITCPVSVYFSTADVLVPINMPTRNAFLDRVTMGKVDPAQLTATKLERLMDRYARKEWLPSRLKHLDFPEAERADVVRGLRTYVLAGPAHARRFGELYAQLPAARRVLGPDVVREFEEANISR